MYRKILRGDMWHIEKKSIGGTGVEFWEPFITVSAEHYSDGDRKNSKIADDVIDALNHCRTCKNIVHAP